AISCGRHDRAKAGISCAPISSRKTPPSCGAITCCWWRSRKRSRTSKVTSQSGRSFTSSRRASRRTSSSPSWPIACTSPSRGACMRPTDLDVYAPERWVDDALFRPEVREAYRRLVEQGWTDALRALHPGERIYTFWKYLRNAFARDAGLRIDHLLLSPSLPH